MFPTTLLLKKLIRRPPSVASLLSLASSSYALLPSKGFYMIDQQIKKTFLVDTGACRSINPASSLKKRYPKDVSLCLVAANGRTIANYGTKTFHLALSGHQFSLTFILADFRVPLLGANFLAHYPLPAATLSTNPPTHQHYFSPHPRRRTSPSSLSLQSSSTFRRNTLRYSVLNFVSFLMFLPSVECIIISRG